MKKIYILFISGLLLFSANAQQLGQFNQYQHNPYVINPAAAGINGDNELDLGFRQQWMSFPDAPTSFYFSMFYDVGRKPSKSYKPHSLRISDPDKYEKYQPQKRKAFQHYAGGMVLNDINGFSTQTMAMVSYTTNFMIGEDKDKMISIGVFGGVNNLNFDYSSITVLEPENDMAFKDFQNYNESTIYLDFGFGAWYKADQYEGGYSVLQLFGNANPLGGGSTSYDLYMHHFLQFRYNYALSEELILKPGVLFRYVNGQRADFDVNVVAYYNQKYWAGLSYRYNAAAVLGLGAKYKNLKLGYSYDMNTTGIRNYQYGSNELFVALVF